MILTMRVSRMKKILYLSVAFIAIVSCSGPSNFNTPSDFMGGNKAAAVEIHCASKAGEGKNNNIYKLCVQSFNNHYGK